MVLSHEKHPQFLYEHVYVYLYVIPILGVGLMQRKVHAAEVQLVLVLKASKT